MKKPLEGIRVADFSIWMFGTVATAHLADMGAEIIKVESPSGGDPGRALWRPVVMHWNSYFGSNNRSKKSIAVDLHTDKGREIAYQLIEVSDVFHSNMQREPLERMGLTYPILSKINPKLIYSLASGFGRTGSARDYPAHDPDGQARAGIMPSLGEPREPPTYTGSATGDSIGALTAAYAIMLALFYREKTGEGQEIDTSLFGSQIMFEAPTLQAYLATKDESLIRQRSRKDAPNPLHNIYKTKDKWVYLTMIDTSKYWGDFCKGINRSDLEHDSRFNTHRKRCGKYRRELIDILDKVLPQRSASEWLERWEKLGLVASPVNTYADLENDPQAMANQYLVDYEHPKYGPVKLVGFPAQFSKTPPEIANTEPELGQHTEEILIDLLGYNWGDIEHLKDQNIIL